MKKRYILLLTLILFAAPSFSQTVDVMVHNFEQVDETKFEWDVSLRRAGGDDFYLYNMQLDFIFNTNIRGTGIFRDDEFIIVDEPLAADVHSDFYRNVDCSVSNTLFGWAQASPPANNQPVVLITDDWIRVVRFQVQLRTSDGNAPLNFASLDPLFRVDIDDGDNIVYKSNNDGPTYTTAAGETEIDISGIFYPDDGDYANTRQLAGYIFYGDVDNDWTTDGNWNNESASNKNAPPAGENVIINGNVTIPDETTATLGELTLLTGEEALYTLTLLPNGNNVSVDIYTDDGTFTLLDNPLTTSAGTEIILFTQGGMGSGSFLNFTDQHDNVLAPVVDEFGGHSHYMEVPSADLTVTANWTSGTKSQNKSSKKSNNRTELFSSLTIAPGGALTVDRLFNDHDDGADAIILQSPTGHGAAGSLKLNNEGVRATVERYIAQHNDMEGEAGWHFLSSPVIDQSIRPEFFPNDHTHPQYGNIDFYYWDESHNVDGVYGWWINIKSNTWHVDHTDFEMGRGYLMAYGPAKYGNKTHTFVGELQVQDVEKAGLGRSGEGDYQGFHLLGNPFSSALEWEGGANDTDWSTTNITGGPQIWNESARDYTPITPGAVIPAMNGFMVQVGAGGGSLTIPADARVHSSLDWYKHPQTGGRIHLVANNPTNGTAKSAMVIFNENAEPGLDNYDYRFLSGHGPRFFTPLDGVWCSVNALPEYYDGLTIPFSFHRNFNTTATEFNIELVDVVQSLIDENYELYLDDLKLGTSHNLTEKPVYEFTSQPSDDMARFLLRFVQLEDDDVSIDDVEPNKLAAAWTYNNTLYIHTHHEHTQARLFDISGREVGYFDIRSQGEHQYQLNLTAGVYLLRIHTNNQVETQRVIIR